MDEHESYSIGDATRRTGLNVTAVRFYSDTGIIAPTRPTAAGHRLYDASWTPASTASAGCSTAERHCTICSRRTWRSSSVRSGACRKARRTGAADTAQTAGNGRAGGPHAEARPDLRRGTRTARRAAGITGRPATAEYRDRLATVYEAGEEMQAEAEREGADSPFAPDVAHDRYLSLVTVVNGTPSDPGRGERVPFSWIAAALRTPAPGTEPAVDTRTP